MCSPKQEEDKSKGNTRKRKANHKLKEMAKKNFLIAQKKMKHNKLDVLAIMTNINGICCHI